MNDRDFFNQPELFIDKFDAPDRDRWQKPDEVISAFNLAPTSIVAEVGAGTGYFTIRLAERVSSGKILAYEQAPKMADYLRQRVSKLGLTNVEVHTVGPDDSLSLNPPADLIFSVDVYHHLQNRAAYFARVLPLLKDDGVLVVIDRTEEKIAGQPHGHRVPAATVKDEMQEAGLELFQELNFLLPVQHYLAFKRAK